MKQNQPKKLKILFQWDQYDQHQRINVKGFLSHMTYSSPCVPCEV